MSPEVIMEQRYSKKSDVWSVGCTVLQMATGNPPYSEFSNHIAALFHITSATEPPAIPANLSEDARNFILMCFERDPAVSVKMRR
jgi:serine/threonine protein kinase